MTFFQLADVPRPGVGLQEHRRSLRDAAHPLLHLLGVLREEVFGQQRDVLAPLAQRRQVHRDDIDPIEQIFSKAAARDQLLQILIRRGDTRMSACTSSVPPSRRNRRSCSTRSSFTCIVVFISPISSRKMVPPSAASIRPFLFESAPVNAPRIWPKSSDSRSVSGTPPQLSATNGRSRRNEL
jgi:hypothetical protein